MRYVTEMRKAGAYRRHRRGVLDKLLGRTRYEYLGRIPFEWVTDNDWQICGINVEGGVKRWLSDEEYETWFGGEDMAKRPALPIFAPSDSGRA